MFEGSKWLISLGLIILTGGCTGVPPLNLSGGPTPSQIVDQIECEVQRAADKYPRLRTENWAAAIDLTLQVDDSIGLTPTVSFIQPLATEGTTFTFGASGALKGSRQRIYAESLDLQVKQIKRRTCAYQPDSFDLTGDLGIFETVEIGVGSIDSGDASQFKSDKAFGQTIQFVVTKNVSGVGPNWTLVHFTGPGGLFGAERIDTHQLIISFAPGAVTKKVVKDGVTTKQIVTFPGAAVDRARALNNQLLLKSLPTFRPAR